MHRQGEPSRNSCVAVMKGYVASRLLHYKRLESRRDSCPAARMDHLILRSTKCMDILIIASDGASSLPKSHLGRRYRLR